MSRLKAILVDPEKGITPMMIQDDLETFYNIIDCDYIEIPHRRIGGKYFAIICDEEALLKPNPIMSGVSENLDPMIFGRMLIANDGLDGELASIEADDAKYICENIVHYVAMGEAKVYTAIKMGY